MPRCCHDGHELCPQPSEQECLKFHRESAVVSAETFVSAPATAVGSHREPASGTSQIRCAQKYRGKKPCIRHASRTKGGVLLRKLQHSCSITFAVAIPLAIALSAGVARAEEDEGSTLPDETSAGKSKSEEHKTYQLPPPSSRWKTVGIGLGFAGVMYAGAWAIHEGFWPEAPGASDLRYPFIGPWMDLGKTGCPSNDTNCGTFGLVIRTAFVVLDGLGQAGGLAIALDGLFTPTASSSATESGRAHVSTSPRVVPVPVPWSTYGGGGLSFVGQF